MMRSLANIGIALATFGLAASIAAAHANNTPEPKKISIADLVVDAKGLMGKAVTVVGGCAITQSSNMFIICSTNGSFIYLSSSTANRESLRYSLKNCSGYQEIPECKAASINGIVGGLFMNSVPILTSAYILFDTEIKE